MSALKRVSEAALHLEETPQKRRHQSGTEAPRVLTRTASKGSSGSGVDDLTLATVEAIYQRVRGSRNFVQVRKDTEEGLALIKKMKMNATVKNYAKHFHFSLAIAIYTLKITDRLDDALKHATEARRLAPERQILRMNFLEAKIIAWRNRPGTDVESCDTCVALDKLERIHGADDQIQGLVHKKMAELFRKRVELKHPECFSDQSTQPLDDSGSEEKEFRMSEAERLIPPLVEEHYKRIVRMKGDNVLGEANKALGLLEAYPRLVQHIPRLKDLDRYFRHSAAETILHLKKSYLYSKALQYLDKAIKLTENPRLVGAYLLLSGRILEEMDLPKAAGQTCSKCKAVAVLNCIPKGVDDDDLAAIHSKLSELYADRVARKHPACSSSTIQTRSVSSLLVHASLPDSLQDV